METVVLAAVVQICHPRPYRFVGERRYPQSAERLGVAEIVINIAEYEFPLAPCIGGDYDAVTFGKHIVDYLELFCGGDVRHHAAVGMNLAHYQSEWVGKHGQAFGVGTVIAVCTRHGERYEMTKCPCHHIAVPGTVTIFAYVGADDTGDILPDTRLFSYYCYHSGKI